MLPSISWQNKLKIRTLLCDLDDGQHTQICVGCKKFSMQNWTFFFKLWKPTFQMQPDLITRTKTSSLFGDYLQCPNLDIRPEPHGMKITLRLMHQMEKYG